MSVSREDRIAQRAESVDEVVIRALYSKDCDLLPAAAGMFMVFAGLKGAMRT